MIQQQQITNIENDWKCVSWTKKFLRIVWISADFFKLLLYYFLAFIERGQCRKESEREQQGEDMQ